MFRVILALGLIFLFLFWVAGLDYQNYDDETILQLSECQSTQRKEFISTASANNHFEQSEALMTALKEEAKQKQESKEPYKLRTRIQKEDIDIAIFKKILAESKRYDTLSPELIISVIESESNFRVDVVSHAGAVGIMQIMPSNTAPWLASMMEVEYKEEYLYDPLYNIEMGSFYLDFLINKYSGDVHSALTAYNRGMGGLEVYKNKNKTTISSYGVKIEERMMSY